MSVTSQRVSIVKLHCDHEPTCAAEFEGDGDLGSAITRAEAAREGWVYNEGARKDFCPDHAG